MDCGDQEIINKIKSSYEQQKNEIPAKIENRRSFIAAIDDYYKKRLKLDPSSEALNKLESEKTILLEASHGAQLPHLGICRLYIKGGDICQKLGNALLIFFVADQYSVEMYPEINKFKFPAGGKKNTNPIVIPFQKESKNKPLCLIAPPSEKAISQIANKIQGSFGPNFDYFLKNSGLSKHSVDKGFFKRNVDDATKSMAESSKLTNNYADWCTRIQLTLLKRTNPEIHDHVLFYPISGISTLQPAWPNLLADFEKINEYKNLVSIAQSNNSVEPYSKDTVAHDQSPLWFYCKNCNQRMRGYLKKEGIFTCHCKSCGIEQDVGLQTGFSAPDIVFSQILTPTYLGISARVVGHIHPYAEVADRYIKERLSQIPPARLIMSSHPTFHGVGDPPEGDTRCSIIRAVIEAEPHDIGSALTVDWNTPPTVYSYYNKRCEK